MLEQRTILRTVSALLLITGTILSAFNFFRSQKEILPSEALTKSRYFFEDVQVDLKMETRDLTLIESFPTQEELLYL